MGSRTNERRKKGEREREEKRRRTCRDDQQALLMLCQRSRVYMVTRLSLIIVLLVMRKIVDCSIEFLNMTTRERQRQRERERVNTQTQTPIVRLSLEKLNRQRRTYKWKSFMIVDIDNCHVFLRFL